MGGGVEAKPERGRTGLERQTKNHRAVPTNAEPRPTDAWKGFKDSFRWNQADFKDDKNLQRIEAKLRSSAKKVVIHSTGPDGLFKQLRPCLQILTDSKGLILSCKKQILEAQVMKVKKANENLLDDLIDEYMSNSLLMLQLCNELQHFIKSARKVDSSITDVLNRGVSKSNKLSESVKNYKCSEKAIIAKVKSLRQQHRNMLVKLKDRIKNFDKELKLARTLKKVVNVVFIGMLSGMFVCTVMAAAMAAPPVAAALTAHPCIAGVIAGGAVGYAFSPVLKEGEHWLLTLIQVYESTLEAHKGVTRSMEAGTRGAIKELDDIMRHVKKVIATGNGLVSSNLSARRKNIIKKQGEFRREIEKLEEKRKHCRKVIETDREKVRTEYDELKRSPVWNQEVLEIHS